MNTLPDLRAAGCRTWKLTPQNIGIIDDAVDKDGIYAKGYWESVDGKTTVTGLCIGTGETRIVAKFGNWVVRHPNGQWAIHTPDCARCDDSGIDPEDSHPGYGPNDYSMGEPPALEPCRNCGPGDATTSPSEPINCGLCLYGSDIGVPGYDHKGPAYINPVCTDHNPDTLTAADTSLVAADCPYGVGPGDGSGCIKPAGHSGDHIVTSGVQVKRPGSPAEADTDTT